MRGWRGALLLATLLLAGCPKQVTLPPPPKVESGPAVEMLAKRNAQIRAVEADLVIRLKGVEGAPGGKIKGHVIADGDRARLDLFTPLGTLGAILLIADGQLQVYSPMENLLMKGPVDSKELASRAPLPIPFAALPSLVRGEVVLEKGTIVETTMEWVAAQKEHFTEVPVRVLEIREDDGGDAPVRQRVFLDAQGGFPTSNEYFDSGRKTLSIEYLEYGAVDGVAFPQKVKASVERSEGPVTLEASISNPKLNPSVASDAFTLTFRTPPRVEEFP